MPGRYTGPLRTIIKGDFNEGSKHVGTARLFMQQAIERMGGDKAFWIRQLPDGTKITVSALGGVRSAIIEAGGEQVLSADTLIIVTMEYRSTNPLHQRHIYRVWGTHDKGVTWDLKWSVVGRDIWYNSLFGGPVSGKEALIEINTDGGTSVHSTYRIQSLDGGRTWSEVPSIVGTAIYPVSLYFQYDLEKWITRREGDWDLLGGQPCATEYSPAAIANMTGYHPNRDAVPTIPSVVLGDLFEERTSAPGIMQWGYRNYESSFFTDNTSGFRKESDGTLWTMLYVYDDCAALALGDFPPRHLFKSTDDGLTWERSCDDFPTFLAYTTIFDNDVIASNRPDGGGIESATTFNRSIDGGNTWEEIVPTLSEGHEDYVGDRIHTMHRSSEKGAYAIGHSYPYGVVLYRTEDEGKSWELTQNLSEKIPELAYDTGYSANIMKSFTINPFNELGHPV